MKTYCGGDRWERGNLEGPTMPSGDSDRIRKPAAPPPSRQMRITYDRSVDAAYIELGDTRAPGRIKTRDVGGGITLDFDSVKQLVGIEVLDASHHLHANLLISAEN